MPGFLKPRVAHARGWLDTALLLASLALGRSLLFSGLALYSLGLYTGGLLALLFFLLFLAASYFLADLQAQTRTYSLEDLVESVLNRPAARALAVLNGLSQLAAAFALAALAVQALRALLPLLVPHSLRPFDSPPALALAVSPYLLCCALQPRPSALPARVAVALLLLLALAFVLFAGAAPHYVAQRNPALQFRVPFLPTGGPIAVLQRLPALPLALSFTQTAPPMLHGLVGRARGKAPLFRAMAAALSFALVVFLVVGVAAVLEFGPVLKQKGGSGDLLQTVQANTGPAFAATALLFFAGILLNQVPPYLVAARESLLFLLSDCSCAQPSPDSLDEEEQLSGNPHSHSKPLMVERVRPAFFYGAGVLVWLLVTAGVAFLDHQAYRFSLANAPLVYLLGGVVPPLLSLIGRGLEDNQVALVTFIMAASSLIVILVGSVFEFRATL